MVESLLLSLRAGGRGQANVSREEQLPKELKARPPVVKDLVASESKKENGLNGNLRLSDVS